MKIQNFANQVARQEGFHDTSRALDALLWISLMFAPGARYARIIIPIRFGHAVSRSVMSE